MPHVQRVPGVQSLPTNYNPATWMLEVSGGATKMKTDSVAADFAAIYADSELAKSNAEKADAIAAHAAQKTQPLTLATKYAATRGQQLRQVLWKLNLVYWCVARPRWQTAHAVHCASSFVAASSSTASPRSAPAVRRELCLHTQC